MSSTQLSRIEKALRTLTLKVEALQEDFDRLERTRVRPISAGDKVRFIRPYKGSQFKSVGKVEQLNSWYWRIVMPGVMASMPKSQASKYLERQ